MNIANISGDPILSTSSTQRVFAKPGSDFIYTNCMYARHFFLRAARGLQYRVYCILSSKENIIHIAKHLHKVFRAAEFGILSTQTFRAGDTENIEYIVLSLYTILLYYIANVSSRCARLVLQSILEYRIHEMRQQYERILYQ